MSSNSQPFPLRRVLRSLAALVVAALLLELGAQAVKTYVLPRKWAKIDATNRMAPQPLDDIDYADTVEGRGARLGKLSVNSLGLRGPEPKLSNDHQAGRLRVYCLGSSTTFGWGASTDAATYPAQLEGQLKTLLPQQQVEVINAGVPGNNSESEYQILKQDLPRLKPDVVILWSGWPDWAHYLSTPSKAKRNRLTDDAINAFQKTGSCRCAEYLRDLILPRPAPPSEEELQKRAGLKKYRAEVLDQFSKKLAEMIALCKQQDAQPVVLGLASPLRVEPEKLSPIARRQAANRLHALPDASHADLYRGVLDFDQTLLETTQKTPAKYIDPNQLPEDPELFFDGVHMNDSGYAALARAVAPKIKDIADCLTDVHPCQ
jgi:lysophospholipase L1-like esterase